MSPVAEYEIFEYKHADEPLLTLEQAAEQAARSRRDDTKNMYRVVAANPEGTEFRVIKIPVYQVYGEMWSRICSHFSQYIFAPRRGR
jgi:hypothetical protein